MAPPKPKKKRRSRTDPARREAAARREEARRQAAEERRQAEEATERRRLLLKTARRVGVPAVIGIAVVAAALFLSRPQREIAGAEVIPTPEMVTDLGYQLAAEVDPEALPAPVCGVLARPISGGELLYSDLYNGAVVLWHAAGDRATAAGLAELAGDFESHVVVSPSPQVTDGVLATAWERRQAYDAVDEELRRFVEAYRLHAPKRADCDPAE